MYEATEKSRENIDKQRHEMEVEGCLVRKEQYENTRARRINKQILIEENIIDESNSIWEKEKDVHKTQ